MVKQQVYNLEYDEWVDIDENGCIVGTTTQVYRIIEDDTYCSSSPISKDET